MRLTKREPYRELGAAALDERRREQLVHTMQRRLERLGHCVHLEPAAPAVA